MGAERAQSCLVVEKCARLGLQGPSFSRVRAASPFNVTASECLYVAIEQGMPKEMN
jgi:hypothetical protein